MNTRHTSTSTFSTFALLFVTVTTVGGLLVATPAHADYGATPSYNSIDSVCSGRNDPNCILKETQAAIQQGSQYQPQFSQNYYNSNQNQNYQSYNSGYNYNHNYPSYNYSYNTPNYSYYTPSSYYYTYPSSYNYQYSYSYTNPSYSGYGYTPVTNSSLLAPWTYYPTNTYASNDS